MGKNLLLKAENYFLKAEQLFRARQFKKAAKKYNSAGHTYLDLEKFDQAKISFVNGSNAFIELDKIKEALQLLRLAGATEILNDDNKEAKEIYRNAISYIPKLRSLDDRNQFYVLFSVLSYLCSYTEAKQEEGLNLIKKIQKRVDQTYFKEHPLIILVTELTICLRDKNLKYLEKIQNDIQTFNFDNAELKLLKEVLLITNIELSLESRLDLDKDLYTTNDTIKLKIDLNTQPLVHIVQDSFYNYEVKRLEITKLSLHLSDNLSSSKKPTTPLELEIGKEYDLEFTIKPNFQLDNPFIGPLFLTFELNSNLMFIYETDSIKPNLISPPPTLDVSTRNLRTPLIDQTFPMEILIQNNSDGEAIDLNIDAEFPEQLKIMRGTTKKQIFSLRPHDEIKWEINLKPLEAGDFNIKLLLNFKDPDQNLIEEVKEFPISIKL